MEIFLANCSNLNGLNTQNLPLYYQNIIRAWSNFKSIYKPVTKFEILDQPLFGNDNIRFNDKPLFLQSFSKSQIKYIKDIWNDELKAFHSENFIFDKLQDKRNWISEWTRIKRSIPKNFLQVLKDELPPQGETERIYYTVKNACSIYNTEEKLVENKHLLLKGIQSFINAGKNLKPNCETKWNVYFDREFEWDEIWANNLHNFSSRKSNQLNWKILHNVAYTEEKLQ